MDPRRRVEVGPPGAISPPPGSPRGTWISTRAEDTRTLGTILGRLLRRGDLVLLEGPLGAGKTTFTQGIARGMNLSAPVTSPSFTLANVYEPDGASSSLFHLDLWRITSPLEALGIGLEEYVSADGPCVIEWPEVAAEVLPPEVLRVVIERVGDTRRLTFDAVGERPTALLNQFRAALSPAEG